MPSKLRKAIGAVKDQTSISLAKVASNDSSNLEVAVLKATSHDDVPIDDRYTLQVVHLVSSNKSFAKACARAIGKRIGRTKNWVVALKSLMLVLRIFQDGDPYFPREVLHAIKRGAKILNLSSFRDDSNSSPWDYTAFVRTFALYLHERLDCFLTGKLQRRYTSRREIQSPPYRGRKANEPVRDMKPAMLLDKISHWQILLERAIGTRPTGPAKMNRLVQISLYAVVQESFGLYKDISDGLALILDSFFHLQYQSCVNAFQTCVRASKQFQELDNFYGLCKSIGIGRTSEYPSIQTVSEELIDTLQEFLKDQSSFPAIGKSPQRVLMLPAPTNEGGGGSGRDDSFGGQQEFSIGTTTTTATTTTGFNSSRGFSEWGSQCTSLEDLISATETGKSPSISIDLEAYSDQFEKKSQKDDGEGFRLSETGSTQSLPTKTSLADLVCLDNWPEVEEQANQELESYPQAESKQEGANQENPPQRTSSNNWELVLAETATESNPSSFDFSSPPPLDDHHYNPFLQDAAEINAITTTVPAAEFEAGLGEADGFGAAPTFQANPTFSAQNPHGVTSLQNEDDPFESLAADREHMMFTGSGNQQRNLLQEQQLWLQQQNKIIAKHMV